MKPALTNHASLSSYAIGFACSMVLTLASFLAAPALGAFGIPFIILSALAQLMVQLVCFLHLGRDGEWNIQLLIFTAVIIFILVGGTLWIMSNLAHLHTHEAAPAELYENGIVAPQNELH